MPEAAMDYGVLVFRGEGVQRDETVGAKWMLIAARRGNIVAQNRVAKLFATGRGVTLDPVEAMKWNFLASKGGRTDPWLDDFTAKQPEALRKDAETRAAAFKPEVAKNGS
jgi:TPR repeat protein